MFLKKKNCSAQEEILLLWVKSKNNAAIDLTTSYEIRNHATLM